jgi:branched-subunit amino acid aminotransferase/4-amino-4-deoxychorismate lyase
MSEPRAYLNGWVSAAQALVPVYDAGFIQGATVSEQLRTFGGRLFRLDEHLARLTHSLKIVGLSLALSADDLARIANDLVAHNHPLLAAGDDLGLSIFVTPGAYATLSPGPSTGPTIGLHTYPLPFRLWAQMYQQGESLVVPRTRQVPVESWPAELKCRSRMHYYLAERQAAEISPGSRALLLDVDGCVTETSTSNVLTYRAQSGLISPRRERILPGISLQFVAELAQDLGIPLLERDLSPADVARSDEVLLSSTPSCLLPVTRFEGRPIADGRPGPIFQRLLLAWSARVGMDIPYQAHRFQQRSPTGG